VFSERLGSGSDPRVRLVDDKGRAFRYELKYYNLVDISHSPRINDYIGIEARFLEYQFNEDISYLRGVGDFQLRIDETYVVQQSVNIFNLKYGINYPVGERFYIDLYTGLGIRIPNYKNPNRIYNPEIDTIIDDDDNGFLEFRRNSHLEGIDEQNVLNFTLGFKFGYKF
jgi:hypothetical protein